MPHGAPRVRTFVGLIAFTTLAFAACERDAGPPGPPGPTEGEALARQADENAPVRVLYICGNRFVLINAHPFDVRVSWRVQGTEEQGEQALKAAPAGDPGFSEFELTVRHEGRLAVYRGDELLAVRDNERTACAPITGDPSFAAAAASAAGQWSAPSPWPIVAVHMHLLFNGKVLAWGKFGDPYEWDPATNSFTAKPSPSWLFCAGHTFLSDGRLLVAGGHISDDHGRPDGNIYSPTSHAWTAVPAMAHGRWYPTATELPDGQVVVMAGGDENGVDVAVPEVWNGASWRSLTTASKIVPYYPRNFVAPNGKIFYAGEARSTRYLNTTGTGSWSFVAQRLYPTRDYGAAVMYLPGKILYAGGGRTTPTAETIDLNQASPKWKMTNPMAYPRRHLNATVLPTGEVLVTGGSRGTTFNEPNLAVRVAEIWNPNTGAWTQVASNAVNRTYHSTTLLMPDARVLHAGSGNAMLANGTAAPDEKSAEYYSPPYLFKGARPTITSAPSSAAYGSSFLVRTPAPAGVSKVSLIAIGSVTHAFNYTQRFMWLNFKPAAGGITVTAPDSRNLAPPGWYMLFILNGNDVPSKAKLIRIQ